MNKVFDSLLCAWNKKVLFKLHRSVTIMCTSKGLVSIFNHNHKFSIQPIHIITQKNLQDNEYSNGKTAICGIIMHLSRLYCHNCVWQCSSRQGYVCWRDEGGIPAYQARPLTHCLILKLHYMRALNRSTPTRAHECRLCMVVTRATLYVLKIYVGYLFCVCVVGSSSDV